MTKIGTYQAKTKLPELLHRVEAGESFTITRNGKAVAKLVPCEPAEKPKSPEEVLRIFKEIRKRVKPGPSIRELIDSGRRY